MIDEPWIKELREVKGTRPTDQQHQRVLNHTNQHSELTIHTNEIQ